MRILRIIASMNPSQGGPVESVTQSTRWHHSLGHESEVACVDSPDAEFLKSERYDHLRIHALGPGRYGWAYSPGLLMWLRNNVACFDAVVVHGLWLYPSYAAYEACSEAKVPYWVFPHGMLDPWFQKLSERPLKSIRNMLYWKLFEHRVLAHAEGVCFTCEQERRLAREPFRPYACREIVVPYGTATPPPQSPEMEAAFRNKCPEGATKPYLLYLSRLHPKKGVDLLINAYVQLLSEGRDLPELVIAGPAADSAYLEKIKQLARPAGTRIHFPGMLQGDAKWGAFYGCEAFILPSHQENFGIVVAEALACGKPVLISNKVNIWHEIQDAGAGLVNEDTEAGARELIDRLQAMSPAEKQSMSKAAVICFDQHFRIEQAAKALLQILEEAKETPKSDGNE